MINEKYTFINYNGLRSKRLGELTNGFTNNLFDNSVVIIDEAHNLISRIVNKLKKEKPIPEDDRGEKEHLPINLSIKLYEYLLSAKNARIVLLSGTPVINYPNEFGILFNILRGYIKTWHITLNIKTNKKVDRNVLNNVTMIAEEIHDENQLAEPIIVMNKKQAVISKREKSSILFDSRPKSVIDAENKKELLTFSIECLKMIINSESYDDHTIRC
jgi:Rad3-related DNA helicase